MTLKSVSASAPRAGRSFRAGQLLLAVGAALSVAGACRQADAQTSIWALNATGPWNSAARWDILPVPGTTTNFVFSNSLLNAGYTATNDIGAFAGVLSILVNNQAASGITVAGGTNVLTLDPTASSITQAGARVATISHLLNLGGGTLTLGGSGHGDLNQTGIISGTGNVVINRTGHGFTRLNAVNTFTGSVTLNSGALDILPAGTSTIGAATNTLIINGGEIRNTTFAGTFANDITLNADMLLRGSNSFAFSGVLSGAGGIRVRTGFPGNSYSFTGASTFMGGVVSETIGNTPNNLILSGANGAWQNAASVELFSAQSMTFDNVTAANGNRVNDAAPISLHRSNVQILGNSAVSVNESLGATTFDGMSILSLVPNAATATQLTFASLNRANGGTLQFSGTNVGQSTIASQTANNTNIGVTGGMGGAIGGGGAAGTTNMSILPYAIGFNTATTATNFPSFGVYDAGVGLRPLAANEYNNSNLAVGNPAADQNVRLLGTNAMVDASRTVNSLLLDSPSAAPVGTGLYGTSPVNVAGGGVIFGLSGGATAPSFPSVIASGLNFGTAQGILHAPGTPITAAISTGNPATGLASGLVVGNLAGSGGVVKSGFGVLLLANDNSFTGGLTINSGQVQFTHDGALGAPGQPLNFSSGLFTGTTFGLTFSPSAIWGRLGDQSVTVNRPINLLPGGGNLGTTFANDVANYSGLISGPGHLTLISNGVVALSPGNTYSGGSTLSAGTVSITNESALGTGLINVLTGTLRTDGAGPVTINRDLIFSGSGNLFTNADLVLNGGVNLSGFSSGSTAVTNLTKTGAGTLTITGDSSLSGAVTIGTGAIIGNQPAAVTGGSVVLSGANGNLAGASGYTLTSNTALVLDNSAANNNNRLSTSTVNLNGNADLTLIGNASGTSEFIGTLNQSPTGANSGFSRLTIRPDANAGAALTAQSFTRATSALLLVRGSNLGSAPGPGTANFFIGNNPTVVGNAVYGTNPASLTVSGGTIITGILTDTTSTGNGSGFATYSAATGVTPFAAYLPLNLSGAPATPVVGDVTAPVALTGAATNAAIRIGTGGSIATGGFTLTLGGAGLTGMLLTTDNSTISGGGALAFGTAQGFIINNGDLGISTQLTGSGGLHKAGTGTLSLLSTSALTGGYTISQGTFQLGLGSSLPAAATSIVAGGATFDLGGNNLTHASIGGFGTYALGSSNLTLTGTGTLQGNLTGSGGLNFQGATFTLAGNSPGYSGAVRTSQAATLTNLTLAANQAAGTGTIFLGSATLGATLTLAPNVTTIANNIEVNPGTGAATLVGNAASNPRLTGTITLNRAFTLTTSGGTSLNGVIQNGSTSFTGAGLIWNSGNYNLNAANTYTNGTQISPGSAAAWLGIGNDAAFGSGDITVVNSHGLRADGGARSISNNLLNTATAAYTLRFGGLNPLTFTGTANLGNAALAAATIEVVSPAPLTYAGVVTSIATGGITKSGGGTLVFAGGGAITGPTTVNAGILNVNGANPLSVGGSGVTVNAHGVLGGTGTINGAVTAATGGILAPGTSPGILTINGATLMSTGSFFIAELGAGIHDRLVVNGTVGLAGANLITTLGYAPANSDLFWIIVNDLTDAVAGTFAGLTEGAIVALGDFGGDPYTAQISYIANFGTGLVDGTGNDVVLYNIIPAPGAAMLLGMGGLLAARRRRR